MRSIKINRNTLDGNLKELSAAKILKELNVPSIQTAVEDEITDSMALKEKRDQTISKDDQKLIEDKKRSIID